MVQDGAAACGGTGRTHGGGVEGRSAVYFAKVCVLLHVVAHGGWARSGPKRATTAGCGVGTRELQSRHVAVGATSLMVGQHGGSSPEPILADG